MKKWLRFFPALLLIAAASCAHREAAEPAPALSARTYSIVIPDEATSPERSAALELALTLNRIVGEALPVVAESQAKTPHAIYVGKCRRSGEIAPIDYDRLGIDGIRLYAKNGDLVLTGGKRGTVYAVFTFLRDYAGCRWFAEDCVVIPERPDFRIPEGIDVTYVPPLEYRHCGYVCGRNTRIAVANMDNGHNIPEEWGGHVIYNGFVHTFLDLVPLSVYASTHPEYYAEVEGKRVLTRQTQLCLTNPDVLKVVIEGVKKRLRQTPEAIVSVSQTDNNDYYCRCAKCTELAEAEGSQSGPMIHFVNAVARAIKDEFPNAAIDTLAYGYTRKPPLHVKAEPNVIVRLCSIACCFSHPMESDSGPNVSFREDLKRWGECCHRLYVWDYIINYKHAVLPFPNFHTLEPNIRFLIENHVTSIFEEANHFCRGGEFEHLRSYIATNCLWNPDFDVENGIREFTDAYYGAAAPLIRAYIKLMTDHGVNRKNVHMRIYGIPEQHFDDKPLMDRALAYFVEAEQAVADDPVRLARVQGAKLPVLYTRLCLYMDEEPVREAMLREFETIARRYQNFRVAERAERTLDWWLEDMRKPKPDPDAPKPPWRIPY